VTVSRRLRRSCTSLRSRPRSSESTSSIFSRMRDRVSSVSRC
jgi:hypothetical protein